MKKYFSTALYASFLAPALILYTVFLIAPFFVMIPVSFQNNNSIINLGFVGWNNYIKTFNNESFWLSQLNVLKLLALLFLSMPLGWIMAFALNRTRGWVGKVFRFAALFPAILAITTIAKLFQGIYNTNWGLINTVLRSIGLEQLTRSWLSSKDTAMWCIGICNVWCGIGTGVIIKEAAMRGIPQSYVESAMLDGCTPTMADWRIRFPLLRNILQYDLITGVVGTLCIYALIDVISITNVRHTATPMTKILDTSMKSLKFGEGCAMGLIFFVECVAISLIITRLTRWEPIEY